jgi:dTDP-4-dehydrorhamnose reductase
MDITDKANVAEVIGKHKPDFVIHTAAMTNVDQCEGEKEACWQQNVDAVSYIAAACEQNGVFLLHLSTDFIFDGEAGPYDENGKANPISYYGESKLAAEEIVFKTKSPWAIARTVLVYGITPRMSRTNIILWVKKSLEEGKNIKVVTDQFRTPTLAEDLALGCYLIIKHKATGIFNISGAELMTPYDMAIATADYFKLDASLITKADGSIFTQPAKRPPRTGFIIDKARKQLDYEPHTFEEGIRILAGQLDWL